MSAYKNVAGEKAYIGDISHYTADLIFCKTFKDPQEVFEKVKHSHLAFQNVEVDLICHDREWDGHMKTHMDAMYGARIEGVPMQDAFNLPDWKEGE